VLQTLTKALSSVARSTGEVVWTYDAGGRVAKEDLSVPLFTKMYTQKPTGAVRGEVSTMYPSMRARRPIEKLTADTCAMAGTTLLGNPIDLRPFYAMSPNTSMLLSFGVTRATVTFTYPAPR